MIIIILLIVLLCILCVSFGYILCAANTLEKECIRLSSNIRINSMILQFIQGIKNNNKNR